MKAIRGIQTLSQGSTYDEMETPVGQLIIITSTQGLHAILWDKDCLNPTYEKMMSGLIQSKTERTILQTKNQLTECFESSRKTFDLPLVFEGSEFQMQAWNQLLKIPYSSTISYAEQAEKVGHRNKARAVGMANGLNPIPIVIPCHRVIGSDGKLTGFGGGIEKKRYLLNLEQH